MGGSPDAIGTARCPRSGQNLRLLRSRTAAEAAAATFRKARSCAVAVCAAVAALLVAMDRPVTVVRGEEELYKGEARCPLEIALSDAPSLRGEPPLPPPLRERLLEIQKKATYLPLPAASQPAGAGQTKGDILNHFGPS